MAKKSIPAAAQGAESANENASLNLREERIQELTDLIAARMPPRRIVFHEGKNAERFVVQCGDRSVALIPADPPDDRAHYAQFAQNLTRAAAVLSRAVRQAAERDELAAPADAQALAGIECLTELAAEISAVEGVQP